MSDNRDDFAPVGFEESIKDRFDSTLDITVRFSSEIGNFSGIREEFMSLGGILGLDGIPVQAFPFSNAAFDDSIDGLNGERVMSGDLFGGLSCPEHSAAIDVSQRKSLQESPHCGSLSLAVGTQREINGTSLQDIRLSFIGGGRAMTDQQEDCGVGGRLHLILINRSGDEDWTL